MTHERRPIRFRYAVGRCAYDAPPCGPSARVVPGRLTKSSKIPTRNIIILPLVFLASCSCDMPVAGDTSCSRKRAVKYFGWVFFLISSGSPHVRPMGRTCGEPDEIELTAMGVKLNGSRCRHRVRHQDLVEADARRHVKKRQRMHTPVECG